MSNALKKLSLSEVAESHRIKPSLSEDPDLWLQPSFGATLDDWEGFYYNAIRSLRYATAFLNREISKAWFWQKGRLDNLLLRVDASARDLAELKRIAGEGRSRSRKSEKGGRNTGGSDGGDEDPPAETMARAFLAALNNLVARIAKIFSNLRKNERFNKAWTEFWQKVQEEAIKKAAREGLDWILKVLFGVPGYSTL